MQRQRRRAEGKEGEETGTEEAGLRLQGPQATVRGWVCSQWEGKPLGVARLWGMWSRLWVPRGFCVLAAE